MSHENTAHRLCQRRFKDDKEYVWKNDDDEGIFVHVATSVFARDSRAVSSPPLFHLLSFHSLSGRPKETPSFLLTPLTKTNGTYLFHGTPASGFPLSPLCIALVKHFLRFFFPFHPPFFFTSKPAHFISSTPRCAVGYSSNLRPYFPRSICMRMYGHVVRENTQVQNNRPAAMKEFDCTY